MDQPIRLQDEQCASSRPNVLVMSQPSRCRALQTPTIFSSKQSLTLQRPAVGSSDWLGIWCDCLLARSLGRVMVGNQPPASLLLYPHPGKASVTGNSLAFVLPIHY